ncbi:MAG: TolC family protein [Gammaproteobacteria bacterium]
MRVSPRCRAALLIVVGLALRPTSAAEVTAGPLPEPLSLAAALALADEPHPDLRVAAAETELAQAQRDRAAAAYGTRAGLSAVARWAEPAELAFDPTYNNSQASLYINRRLYDFGQTRAAVAAADALSSGQHLAFADARLGRGLEILERYLDVLLADLDFRTQDEAMATAFVRLDRVRDQQALGQRSDVEYLEAETRYQEIRSMRLRAQARQRTTRVRLAEALNRPGQLSSSLLEPDLQGVAAEPPPLAALTAAALRDNPRVQALRAASEAARERLHATRALDRPVITAEARADAYQRQTGASDPWSVGVRMEVPLYTGGRSAAERAQARAELDRSGAYLAQAELHLRQDLQALWEEIQVLRESREEARTRLDYRELYLDRSRALYEMEVNADLGDAMVVSTEARYRQAQLDYRLLLNRARLNALLGRPIDAALTDGLGEEEATP